MPQDFNNIPIAGPGSTPTAPVAAPTPEGAPTAPTAPEAPAGTEVPRELSPLERFHPSLDPSKVELTFDEQTGRVKVISRAPVESPVEETVEPVDTAPAYIPPITPEAPVFSAREQEMMTKVGQMEQALALMLQAQVSGRPITELLGVQQPQQPAAPDYSQVDMYDPAQAAQLVQSVVRAELQASMQQHQPILDGARHEQEFRAIHAQHGNDPLFQQKAVAAIQRVQAGRSKSIVEAYDDVNHIYSTLAPQPAQQAKAPSTQGVANNASRTTLTPTEQQALAEKAKALPSQGSGVRGAGMPNLPKHIKGLGNIGAWVAQQAQLGNL